MAYELKITDEISDSEFKKYEPLLEDMKEVFIEVANNIMVFCLNS